MMDIILMREARRELFARMKREGEIQTRFLVGVDISASHSLVADGIIRSTSDGRTLFFTPATLEYLAGKAGLLSPVRVIIAQIITGK